ncbi:dihydroxyacetone kinase family protein [Nigerium massiliense]|uniref:dihydroxyacetone kinase family protein n=1 Tax=Nigerium massiliense TaxID=1522317 RepID=UPI00058DB060|nr:dihydroxyacetone kinase family protein [Nigerium massiliense]
MARLTNDPADYAEEALEGFALANKRYVKPVYGGVVRSTKTEQGKVALIVGGGSGHYPAFAGWVGPGFADGAVAGNIFASPSGAQAYSVCKAADRGAGILIGFGNYAGDVLHFGQAVERLGAEGIDARTLLVTDDIASASPAEHLKRRGIAGDLPTFKVTGAACEAGKSIDEVVAIFDRVNERTRSFGVAFDGCTLPGADDALFHVEPGTMGIGLGIHGEPGIDSRPLGTADEIADLLVDGLLADRPDDSGERVVAIVNGLGSCAYEDLFMVYRRVARRLADAGVEVVEGEVGEFVTSLDMAGLSLTLLWLDDVIEPLWFAACDTPAYRKGSVAEVEADDAELSTERPQIDVGTPGSAESQQVAQKLSALLGDIATMLKENEKKLGDLDAVAGDGDHGSGMVKGSAAAAETAQRLVGEGAGAQTLLVGAGDSWSERAGGTSGALWGAMLTAIGNTLGDADPVDQATQAAALRAALDACVRLGGAHVGDKTLVDALSPMVDTFEGAADGDAGAAWISAAQRAQEGADSTTALVAKLGRARPLGKKSVGTPDPGAVSLAMIAALVAERVSARG